MSKGNAMMNERDRLRMPVMEKVKAGEMTLGEAGEAMNMSRRRAKRVRVRYREDGAARLPSRPRGLCVKPAAHVPADSNPAARAAYAPLLRRSHSS